MQPETIIEARGGRTPSVVLALCLIWFILIGILVIAYPGVETDEALFASGVFAPSAMAGHFEIFGRPLVLMLMSYLGGLKSWLYTPVFSIFDASVWSIRVPTLLLGALGVFLIFRYLRRIAGVRAAVIGAVLLAADCTYLLTTTFDWGPVALQLTLTLGGLVLILRFFDRKSVWHLAGAFFCAGLGLWDKALFLWMFTGILMAGAIFYFREIWRLLTVRRVLVAGLAFVIGALPFISYNLSHDFATFKGNSYSFNEWDQNTTIFLYTLQGSAMAGFLVDYHGDPGTQPELSGRERAHVWLSELTGHPVNGFLPYLLILALLSFPLAWRAGKARLLLFLATSAGIAWFQMMLTDGAGGSAHHSILIWPHVIGFIAVSLAAAMEQLPKPGRWVIVAAIALVVCSNVMVMNQYMAGLITRGAGPLWSDACFPLIDAIEGRHPRIVYAADWGMGDTVRLLLMNRIPLGNAIEPFSRQELDEFEREQILKRITHPEALFVANTAGRAHFPKGRALVREWAAENGWVEEPLEVVRDRHGREVFEIYRFVRAERLPGT